MHITVIAKSPIAGRVKTRLCPPCTPEQAAAVAEAALRDTLDAVADLAADVRVRPTLLLDGPAVGALPSCFQVYPQSEGSLNDRLANGFDQLGPGVIVGMDSPQAIPLLRAAIDELADGRDLLGPACDGGYWAIGLAKADRKVFSRIEMSVPTTGKQQLDRLSALGRDVEILPIARDLDTIDDLRWFAGSETRRLASVARCVVAEIRCDVL